MEYSPQYNLGFVAFNNLMDVESMIVSIRKWRPEGLKRCLLVDHSSDDSIRTAIEAAVFTAGWAYVAKENGGFGAGVNELVLMSSDCVVLVVLNLDIHFRNKPPFLEMTSAIVHGAFSLVGTSLLNALGLEAAGRLPPFSEEMLFWTWRTARQSTSHSIQSLGRVEKWHGAVHGACFAIYTEDFRRVGGLDENLFLYAEEFDLQIKLSRFSKHIGFVTNNSIVHRSEGVVNENNSVLNAYNLRYLAIRERKIVLSLYFTLLLVKLIFGMDSNVRKPWMIIYRVDLNRKAIVQQLSQQRSTTSLKSRNIE
jgi:GT2 family glycosyltransferase